jgi:hypothetical protein
VTVRLWLIAWVGLFAAHARADGPRVHLTWTVPMGMMCPAQSALASDVEQLTGQRFVADRERAEVRLSGRIEGGADGMIARIDAHTADGTLLGTRELSAADCPSLRRPLGLVLALLLDQPEPARRTRSGWSTALGVQAALDGTVLPRIAPGLGLSLTTLPHPGLRVRAAASYWFPERAETARGSGADLFALSGGLGLCPRLVAGTRAGLWLCFEVQAGRTLATPRGLDSDARRSIGFANASLELAGSLALGRGSALWLAVGPAVSLTRPALYFDRPDGSRVPVHRAPPVGAIIRLALTMDVWGGHGSRKNGE